jgi:chromosome segregation ATPase
VGDSVIDLSGAPIATAGKDKSVLRTTPSNTALDALQVQIDTFRTDALKCRKDLGIEKKAHKKIKEKLEKLKARYDHKRADHKTVRRALRHMKQSIEKVKHEADAGHAHYQTQISQLQAQHSRIQTNAIAEWDYKVRKEQSERDKERNQRQAASKRQAAIAKPKKSQAARQRAARKAEAARVASNVSNHPTGSKKFKKRKAKGKGGVQGQWLNAGQSR